MYKRFGERLSELESRDTRTFVLSALSRIGCAPFTMINNFCADAQRDRPRRAEEEREVFVAR